MMMVDLGEEQMASDGGWAEGLGQNPGSHHA